MSERGAKLARRLGRVGPAAALMTAALVAVGCGGGGAADTGEQCRMPPPPSTEPVGDIFMGDKGAFASPDSDANIGSGTLKAFVVTFDYANRRISLERSADYQADGYERLGMWFNQSARGPYLEVMAVTPGAPAEQAGIKAGDLLSTLDGIAVGEKSLSDWRAWSRQLPLERPLIMTLGDGSERRLITANLLPD